MRHSNLQVRRSTRRYGRHHPLEYCVSGTCHRRLRGHGIQIEDESLAHLSPIGWEHINLTGD